MCEKRIAFVSMPVLAFLLELAVVPAAHAADIYRPFKIVMESFEAVRRDPPPTGEDWSVETLAEEIDWLEHYVDKYGTIVAKHPDVWGESRLMRHRYEYERQMAAELDQFEVTMNAALRRSDQAFLGMALSLQAATGNRRGVEGESTPVELPNASETNTYVQTLNGMIPTPGTGDQNTGGIYRTAPFQQVTESGKYQPVPGFTYETDKLSLEPTIRLDQLSRYINHLHELRRINEGDDIADSPGYALNLVRIPVSVLPGKQTRSGYGAEITIIAEPYLSEDLLPVTFRDMVVNDVVDMLAPALTHIVNDPKVRQAAVKFRKERENAYRAREQANELGNVEIKLAPGDSQGRAEQETSEAREERRQQILDEAQEIEEEATKVLNAAVKEATRGPTERTTVCIPSAKSRRSRLPLPPSQMADVYGQNALGTLADEVIHRLGNESVNQPYIQYMDVRAFVQEETQAAYDLLSGEQYRLLWTAAGHTLANSIRQRNTECVKDQRNTFYSCIGKNPTALKGLAMGVPGIDGPILQPDGQFEILAPEVFEKTRPSLTDLARTLGCCEDCKNIDGAEPSADTCKTTTAALAWAIIVESSLLNDQLIQDMREAGTASGRPLPPTDCMEFFHPFPSPEARMAFNDYVRCRWPIRVFALDPVTQDQNVADAFSRRRELQVAAALGFASGQMNEQALMRFTRRLEWDMATIQLNRTVVGFSHGSDTFGWRFYPRFQTPPTPGTFVAFGQTLFGGPSRDADIRQRELESGTRECTAIVVMPSFVPYVTFDVRTNWFKLTNPKQTEVSMKETLELSRSIKAMQQSAAMCAQCAYLYRDGEVSRLLRRVEQLDRELPLQTMVTQIPYENTAGGFELFNHGITDLAPELIGWYGAPGINPASTTTMYLVGDGFSVHDTKVIAGGRVVPFVLISRQLMQAEIPAGLQVLPRARPGAPGEFDPRELEEVVDVHVATPYGVSSHLLVPVASAGLGVLPAFNFELGAGARLDMNFGYQADGSANKVTIDEFFYFNQPALVIRVPRTVAAQETTTVTFSVRDPSRDRFLGQVTLDSVPFNASAYEYYITGPKLVGLVRTAGPNSLNGVVDPYLEFLNKDESLTVEVSAALPDNYPVRGVFEAVYSAKK
jgi:hypothetical protein